MARGVVVFDAAGTLLELRRPVGESYAAIAGEVGGELDPARIEVAFREAFLAAPPLAFGRLEGPVRIVAERAWWRECVRDSLRRAEAGTSFPFERFFDLAWQRFSEPDPWRVPDDVRPGLRALRRQGIPLAVFSNWDARLERLLVRLGLGGYFARILVSGALAAAKPDRRGYEAAQKALRNIAEARPLMVGDRLDHDVGPALAAGWHAIWLDRADREEAPPAGAGRVDSLRGLARHPLVVAA